MKRSKIHKPAPLRASCWLACLSLLSACASYSPPQNPDTALHEAYAPLMQQGLQQLDTFSKTHFGLVSTAPRIRFTGSEATAKTAPDRSGDIRYILVPKSMSSSTSIEKIVARPIRLRTYELLKLMSGEAGLEKIPQWLRQGTADMLAYSLIDGMKLPLNAHQHDTEHRVALRAIKALNVQALWSEKATDDDAFVDLAYLANKHLADLSGERFWPAYKQYISAAKQANFSSDAAFAAAFGLSSADFQASAKAYLEAIYKEKLGHNRPIPAASANPPASFPLADAGARKGYTRYLAEKPPKAFAISSRGAWSYRNDQVDAIDEALASCRIGDPLNCQLYAVDDRIVYEAPVPGSGKLLVSLVDDDGDTWTEIVKKNWLPLIQTSAELFQGVLRDELKVELAETIHIDVAASQAQYEKVLREKFGHSALGANRTGEFSGGIANGRGQISLHLRWTYGEASLRETSIKTTLHELVHELQGQLSQGEGSFHPPRWMDEGIADLVSEGLAQKVAVDGSYHYSLETWLEQSKNWYRKLGGKADIRTMFGADYNQWLQLVADEKGPYYMASLMSLHLKNLLGDKFNNAWIKYYRLAGTPNSQAKAAFKDSFGMSEEAYIASLQTWLNSL